MKQLGIFTLKPDSYTSLRFKEEATKLSLKPTIIPYYEIDFDIQVSGTKAFWNNKPLPRFDLVIFGRVDLRFTVQRDYLLSLFLKQDTRVLNAESLLAYPRIDKLNQHFLFQEFGLPFVETRIFGSRKQAIDSITNFPVIIKNKHGSKGELVYKIHNQEELIKLLGKSEPSSLLVQPFLKAGEDIRVIVLGFKALGAMKRIAQPGQYLTNFSAGGRVEKYLLENDSQAVRISETLAKNLHMEYGGVDLMKNERGDWQILEFNRPCQFEGFEKATGMNLAGNIIDYLMKK